MTRMHCLMTGIVLLLGGIVAAQTPQQRQSRGFGRSGAFKTRIAPNWFDDNNRFWYVNEGRDGTRRFVVVDAVEGQRKQAFDHSKLAESLRDAGVNEAEEDRLPISALMFDSGATAVSFRAADKVWKYHLETDELNPIEDFDPARHGSESDVQPIEVPRASTRTGPETELQFVNETKGIVELLWLDTGGDRHSYGTLAAGQRKHQHTYAGHVWLVVDAEGAIIAAFEGDEQPGSAVIKEGMPAPRWRRGRFGRPTSFSADNASPDGKWRATLRDGNVFVEESESGREFQVSEDGDPEHAYEMVQWSPDSRALVAFRVEPGERKEVFLVESSPRDGGRAILHQRPYALPGDRFSSFELTLFRQDQESESDEIKPAEFPNESASQRTWRVIKPQVERIDFERPRVRWNHDGSSLTYVKVDRGHQRYRLIEVDARTGESRQLIDEQTDTFIWTAHTENIDIGIVNWLEQTGEIIYVSEVDGWRHLYLIDPMAETDHSIEPQVVSEGRRFFAPGLKNQITRGEYVVRGVDRIDEEQRQVWFHASGGDADQDPYLVHYYRVNFDGSGLVKLTEGNGNHSIQYSPDQRYIIDTYSRIDLPPRHELRRVADGSLICKLEEADISELTESGWQEPEVFVAKGRDGRTDIWGIICRPRDFDPNKKYPVIEDIYAGPHGSFVPKTFSSRDRYESLNDLGFIVVKIDGMGTANRSKAFHDVCWHNLKDAGFPDRIRWMKAAAQRYPYMDLSRIGIYGGSAGGQNAAGALLFHGDFYKVAVAGCGCHDNRMDKASWNEQWMGYPVGPQYSESSNIDHANRLQGKLLLIVGEMDTNVPPESTMRLADALIKADKDFDLIVVPGAGHGMGGRYGQRRMHDFFVHHLLGNSLAGPRSPGGEP